ncbi:MAG: hypothetical protein E6I97_27870 [Chloroflexi bacterium]|nr:MAG: hypothetical protein E6I97_27870 [Chloroflexota bacterium]
MATDVPFFPKHANLQGIVGITANVVSPGMVLNEGITRVVPLEFPNRVVDATWTSRSAGGRGQGHHLLCQ